MNTDKDVQVNIPADYNGSPIKVEIYHGDTPKPKEIDKKVNVNGSIFAPWEYVSKLYDFDQDDLQKKTLTEDSVIKNANLTPFDKAIVSYHMGANGGKPWIKFDEFPASLYDGAVIFGSLEPNPDIEPWRINTDQFFSNRDLQRIIRQNAFAFADVKEAESLIKTLQNFSVSFETDIEKTDDRQGNKTNKVDEFIKWNKGKFENEITLWLPLFKGTAKEHIHLSIELERKNNEVTFGFYSIDLTAKLRGLAERTVGAEVEKFKKLFVTIEVL